MELFRCRICGEVYFGKKPDRCPYCGAHEHYLVFLNEWKDENAGIALSAVDRDNLNETKNLEYTNTRFYRAAANTSSPEVHGFFKYLARVENEHYNITCKLLGDKKDSSIFEPSESQEDDLKNLEYSKGKEEHASALYKEFIKSSSSERLKVLFTALSEIEADHIVLDSEEIDIVNK